MIILISYFYIRDIVLYDITATMMMMMMMMMMAMMSRMSNEGSDLPIK